MFSSKLNFKRMIVKFYQILRLKLRILKTDMIAYETETEVLYCTKYDCKGQAEWLEIQPSLAKAAQRHNKA